MHDIVYSKIFALKLRVLNAVSKQDVLKAVNRVAADPTPNQYKRAYLTPYLQDHPTDKTLTIFFKIETDNKVFLVWINDQNHPHDTHKNHGEDPCIKEFSRLKNSNLLECLRGLRPHRLECKWA
jgi:hypothetical protein